MHEIIRRFTGVGVLYGTLETMRRALWHALLEHKHEGVGRFVPKLEYDESGVCTSRIVAGSVDEY